MGTEDRPFCEFSDAATTVPEGGEGVIRLLSPAWVFDVQIDGGRSIAVLAARENARFGTGDFTSGNWIAIDVVDSNVFLDSIVVNSNGYGISVRGEGARLYLDNVVVASTAGGVNVAEGAEAFLRNATVVSQHGGQSHGLVMGTARLEMVYSTIIATEGSPLYCDNGSEVVVRNSILLTTEGIGDTIVACDNLSASFSALSTAGDVDGVGVVEVGFFEFDRWFQSPLVDLPSLRLTSQGATLFRGLATWEDGDPPSDADGHPRPSVQGTADYPGHDVPG